MDRTIAEKNDESGTKHIDHSDINLCFHRFYSKLYDSESLGNHVLFDSFFRKINVPTINNKTASELDKPFSVQELMNAIKLMQAGKSPAGFLPRTMRQAIISLIPKNDKNLLDCGSYHPISLLNVDSKILSKMLACHLEAVLLSVVVDDQTGFMKGRHSFFNIRRLFNILYGPTLPDIPEILLSLDAENAFDRVERDYLFYTLKQFGFGEKFISWIKVLYSTCSCSNKQ